MSVRLRLLIAVGIYPDGGGISSIVENYVADLRDRYDVHVAIVEARPGWERLETAGARVHVIGYTNAINPLLFPTSLLHAAIVGRALRRIVRVVDPELVITQDALHLGVPALLATRGRPARVAIMDHGTLTNVYEPSWLPMLRRRLSRAKSLAFTAGFRLDAPWRAIRWRLGVRYADALWHTGSELEPWFRGAGSRRRRYSQSVPSDFVPAAAAGRNAAREALGLPTDRIVVNNVGRLDGEKGLGTIAAAFDDDSLKDLPFTLVFAGDGSLEGWLRKELSDRGLDDHVLFLGRLARDEVVRLQQASDLHLYAGTFSCGVSICLLEAMAAGVAPIASDQPSAQRELIGTAGWVFAAGDVAGLRRALVEGLSMTRSELAELGVRAQEAVHHQPDPTVPKLVETLLDSQ